MYSLSCLHLFATRFSAKKKTNPTLSFSAQAECALTAALSAHRAVVVALDAALAAARDELALAHAHSAQTTSDLDAVSARAEAAAEVRILSVVM